MQNLFQIFEYQMQNICLSGLLKVFFVILSYLKIFQRSYILLSFIFIFSGYILIGQQDFINNRPQLTAQFINSSITIDGKISSDKVWSNVKPITSLTQMTPNFGYPVSEDTQIRLAYNNFYFYVSVICFDSSSVLLKNPELF